jgi:hypothetical protein
LIRKGEDLMSESMITVILIVGDPGAEDLQLNEGCLAAAAKSIRVHGAATRGRWDAGRRSTLWCFDIDRARAADLQDDLQDIWAGKLESVVWRTVGPAEIIRFA